MVLSRRRFLRQNMALGAGLTFSGLGLGNAPVANAGALRLKAHPARAHLVGKGNPDTAVWCYNNQVPGPEIRIRQGERLRVVLENGLDQDTTVHWHGIRLPIAMDGVPGFSQSPVQPGEEFLYEFTVPDAGTYWYHPHVRSFEQIDRGLHGALIVEEREPITVDQDVTWVLDDWRLTRSAEINDDYAQRHDLSHGGRIGNVATINGRIEEQFGVRAGARWRLRLINSANARHFGLRFEGHDPHVIAIDGHPVTPHKPENGLLVLGPAMRIDIVLDMTHEPGSRFRVLDEYYRRQAYRLVDLVYSSEAPLRESRLDASMQLPPNDLPEPDPEAARHEFVFAGGAMGGMKGAMLDNQWTDMRTIVQQHDMFWAINGQIVTRPQSEPLLECQLNQSYRLLLKNDTSFSHPMHLHGHVFRVLSRSGKPVPYQPWQDTVLVMPGEQVEVAFVADNPGNWLFHCHIPEHMMSGMSGFFRVG